MSEYNWYALYTKSRSEKKTALELQIKQIEVFLPMIKTIRQWSDRKKMVEVPLINSYLFVKVSEREYYDVLNTPGAVKYISFGGKASPIREDQIDLLKKMIKAEISLEVSHEKIEVGQRIKIIAGPFIGTQAEVVQIKNNTKLIVRFDQLSVSFLAEISKNDLELLN